MCQALSIPISVDDFSFEISSLPSVDYMVDTVDMGSKERLAALNQSYDSRIEVCIAMTKPEVASTAETKHTDIQLDIHHDLLASNVCLRGP